MAITRDFTSGSPPNHDATASNAPTVAVNFAVSAGDLMVVTIAFESSTITVTSVTDTSGNTYVQAGAYARDTNSPSTSCVFHCLSVAAAAANTNTITVHLSGSITVWCVAMGAHLAGATWSLDKTTGTSGTTGNPASGNVTTTSASEYAVACCYADTGSATSGSGWTSQFVTSLSGLSATEDQILTSTATIGGNFTQGSSGNWSAIVATFSATTSGGTPSLPTQGRSPGFPTGAPLPGITRLGVGLLDAPNPGPTPAQKIVNPLPVQQRAPGFPPAAPLPGVALLGLALLAAPPVTVGPLAATMAGTGALSATPSGTGALSATMAATGALSASGITTLADVGSIQSQKPVPGFPSSAPLPGVPLLNVGVLQASPPFPGPMSGVFAGVGALSAALTGAGALADTMAGVGALTATLSGAGALASVMAATGALSASGITTLADVGSVQSQRAVPGFPTGAPLPGIALLNVGVLQASPPFFGPLTLTANATGALVANLAGSGALSDTMSATGALVAGLTGSGALSTTFAGVGTFTAAGITTLADVGSIPAQRRAPGYPRTAPLPGIPQLGEGVLVAPNPTPPGFISAAMNGVGAMSATLLGAGALADVMAGTGALTGTLGGSGALSDVLAGTGALSATLTGSGALASTQTAIGTLFGSLTGSGALADTLSATGALLATLSGAGALVLTTQGIGAFLGSLAGAGFLGLVVNGAGHLVANLGVGGLPPIRGAIRSEALLVGIIRSESLLGAGLSSEPMLVASIRSEG